MQPADANQANVEYFFRLLYECFHGGSCAANVSYAWFFALLAKIWLWIVYIGYALSVIALFLIIYETMRLFELRKREEEYYSTLIEAPESTDEHPRWTHIESLAESGDPSAMREAIIEADILLDETLRNAGYMGDTIGDMLKGADRLNFATLDEAWEAHKVRNQIAHQGSAFVISDELAHRTLQRYESVFREFKVV